jgi:GDPmannose 4,6-dehydratase
MPKKTFKNRKKIKRSKHKNKPEKRRALITGITGQDGSYLAEFLVDKGYEVYGLMRRVSTDPLMRLEDLHLNRQIKLIYGSMRDLNAVGRALDIAKPDEIYNLAAQSHVGVSFECPEETWDTNYYGVGRIVIEAMRRNPQVRIYQASTSEMFGATPPPQHEKSAFRPVSPYAEAKLKAHLDYVVGSRDKHGLFICSGILFNHESPRRGKHFVTRKITHSLAKVKLGMQEHLRLGNLNAKRDWGYAKDYVVVMWKMLQQKKPEDFVIATGEYHSVREFVNATAAALNMKLTWSGKGVKEVAKDEHGKIAVMVDPKYYRPTETNNLLGDSSKAKRMLKWKPSVRFEELVKIMADADLSALIKHKHFSMIEKESAKNQ